MEPRFLTVAEAARYLRLNPRSVYLLAQRGGIPASRVTGQVAVPGPSPGRMDRGQRAAARTAGDAPAAARALLPTGNLAPGRKRRPGARAPPGRAPGPGREARSSSPPPSGAAAAWRPWGKAGRTSPPAPTPPRPPGSPTSRTSARATSRAARGRRHRLRPGARPRGLDRQSPEARGGPGPRPSGSPLREPPAGIGDTGVHRGGAGGGPGRAGRVVGFRDEVSTHWAVALRVLRGEADAGVATRAVAAALSLGFVPLTPRALRPRGPQGDLLQAHGPGPHRGHPLGAVPAGARAARRIRLDTVGRVLAAWSARRRSRGRRPLGQRGGGGGVPLVSFMWHRRPPPAQPAPTGGSAPHDTTSIRPDDPHAPDAAGPAAAQTPSPARRTLILSTTTSTQDSGLLDVLVPMFEQATGYSVKTISVGTGQALALAARGEADVTLAHAPALEKKYVAEGKMLNRRLVMYNDFVVIGPGRRPGPDQGPAGGRGAPAIAGAGRGSCRGATSRGPTCSSRRSGSRRGSSRRGAWYIESGQGMGQTLGIANERRPTR